MTWSSYSSSWHIVTWAWNFLHFQEMSCGWDLHFRLKSNPTPQSPPSTQIATPNHCFQTDFCIGLLTFHLKVWSHSHLHHSDIPENNTSTQFLTLSLNFFFPFFFLVNRCQPTDPPKFRCFHVPARATKAPCHRGVPPHRREDPADGRTTCGNQNSDLKQ